MSLKENGMQKYRQLVRQNLRQAQYLTGLVKLETALELVSETTLNIVCFRYVGNAIHGDKLNRLNKEILMQLHEKGIAAPTYTFLDGKYVIRVAITNHRTRLTDLDQFVKAVLQLGDELASKI